uniref:Histone-lysine N-methyltransferase 2C n=1 Tax=Petromyzon marinus TaxID=7757 RepID=S4RAT0_PETMA
RWVHASCENLLLEDAVEEAADQGFDCSACRPFVTVPQEPVTPIVPCIKIKEPEPPKVYSRDGVYLTETGLTQLQSLLVPPVPRKQRRPKLRLKLPGQPDLVTELQSPIELHPQSNPLEQEPLPDDIKGGECQAETMECDNKSETFTSPERETQEDSAVLCSKEVDSVKKRKRNPYRPGIGGFMVRHRGRGGAMRGRGVSRRGTGGARSDSLTSPVASDIGRSDDVTSEHLPETPMDEITATPEPIEKQKQRRWRKKKSALEDAFPTYLQEAFFGKGLLDTSKEKRSSLDLFSDEESAQPSEGPQQKPTPPAQSETPEVVARDEAGPTVKADQRGPEGPAAAAAATQRGQQLRAEPLDSLLGTSDLDRIVTDELAKIEAKDVADLFSAISPAGGSQPQPPVQNTHGTPNAHACLTAFVCVHMHSSNFPAHGRSEPSPMMPQASFPEFREKVSSFSPSSNPASPWSAAGAPPAVAGEGEGDGLSYNQRNILKWEKDELLGEMATTSPVLYANINFPNLKTEYPGADWPTRAKQIAKLWRKASASEKAPFLQKARDNRAAVRISKAQRAAWQQLRLQSKQQAKLEATQRLEMAKQEQLLQQRQPQGGQTDSQETSPARGETSADGRVTPQLKHMSPSSNMFVRPQTPGTPTSFSQGDVFVKPQAPGPSRLSSQGSQSPAQSPVNSRPNSPFDTYSKMPGTPRPSSHGDMPAELCPNSPDPFLRPRPPGSTSMEPCSSGNIGVMRQRQPLTPRPNSLQMKILPGQGVSPSAIGPSNHEANQVFKAPLPPHMGPSTPSSPRAGSHDRPSMPQRTVEQSMQMPPSPTRQMAGDPYAQQPHTPRPMMIDPYSQPPLTPRPPNIESFAHPQQVSQSTPYSHHQSTYRSSHGELYPQQRLPPGQTSANDPYSHQPATTRPVQIDPYLQSSSTPQVSSAAQYSQRQNSTNPPVYSGYNIPPCSPRHPSIDQSMSSPQPSQASNLAPMQCMQPLQGPRMMVMARFPSPASKPGPEMPHHKDPNLQPAVSAGQQNIGCQSPQTSGSATPQESIGQPKPLGSGGMGDHQALSAPMQPQGLGSSHAVPSIPTSQFGPQPPAVLQLKESPGGAASTEQQSMGAAPHDAELEKQKQRQKLRELLIRQQQQRKALHQEKALQEQMVVEGGSIPLRHWPQDDGAHQHEPPHNKPPPPYPSQTPFGGQRNFSELEGLEFRNAGPSPQYNSPGSFPQQFQVHTIPPHGHPPNSPQFIELRHNAPIYRIRPPFSGIPQQHRAMIDSRQQMQSRPQGAQYAHAYRPPMNPHIPLSEPTVSASQGLTVGAELSNPALPLHHGSQQQPTSTMPQQIVQMMQQQQHPSNPTMPQQQQQSVPLMRQQSANIMSAQQSQNASMVQPQSTEPQQTDECTQQEILTKTAPEKGVAPTTQQPEAAPTSESVVEQHTSDVKPGDLGDKELDDLAAVKALGDEDDDLENLTLDPIDGKGGESDLDTHLDDLLMKGGEFDLLAYTDPELGMTDKRDMFNEQLGLGDPVEEKKACSSSSLLPDSVSSVVKEEVVPTCKDDCKESDPKLNSKESDSSVVTSCTNKNETQSTVSAVSSSDPLEQTAKSVNVLSKNKQSQGSTHYNTPPQQISELDKVHIVNKSNQISTVSKPLNPSPTSSCVGIRQPVNNQHDMGSSQIPVGSPANVHHMTLSSKPYQHMNITPMSCTSNSHQIPVGSPVSVALGSPAHGQQKSAHLATVGSPAPGQQRLAMNSPHPTVGSPHFTVGSPSSQKQINLQQPGVNPGMPPAMPPGHQGPFTPSHSLPPPSQMSLQKEKSLLLDEQPLLLQDLVEQEKKEQQRQQMQAMLQQQQQRQQSITGSMFPNIDLDKFTPDDITDPIAKAKMVALKGINKVMTQGAMVVPSIARPRIPVMTQQIMGSSDPPPSSGQQIEVGGSSMMQMARPNPPTFGAVMTDADVGQYREWLLHTQALLQMQQKFLEDQIGAHRKSKKALSAKQRTAKKAGRELAEKDAEQLKNVTEQQSMVQKQLEQLRKQQKEHAELIEEFRTKHQQAHASGASSAGMSGALQGPPNMMPMGPGQQAGMGPLGPGQQPGMRPMMPGQQANMRPMGSIHQQGMSPMGPGSQQGMAGMAAGLQQGMGPMGLSLRHMGPGHQQGMRQMMPGQQQAMMSLGPMGPGQQLSMMLLGQMGPDQQQGMRLIGPGQQQGMGSQGQMGPGQQQSMRLLGPGPQQGMPPMGQMVPGQQQVIRMMGPGQQQGLGSMVQMGPGQQQGMGQMGPGQQQGMRHMGPGQQQGMRQLISGQQQGMRPMGQMGPGQHLGMNQMMGVSQQGSGQFGPGQQQGMRLMGPAQQPIGAMGQIGPGQQHTMRQMGPGPQQGMGPGSQHNEMGQNPSSVHFQSMGAMGNQQVTGQRQHTSVGGMEPALPKNKACAAGKQSPVSEVLSKPPYTDVADCQKGEKSNSLPNVIPTSTQAINPAPSNKQQGFSGSSQSRNMFLQSHPGVQAVPSGQGKNDGHVTPDPVHTPGTGGHMADSPSRVSSDGATNLGSTNQEQADESKPIGMMVSGTENMKTEASASENYEVEFQKQPNIVSSAQSEVTDGPLRHQAMLSAIQVQSNQPTIHLERAQQQQHQQRFMGPGHLAHGQMSRQQQHLMMGGPEMVHPGQGGIYPYRPGFPGNGAMFQQHVGPSGPRGPHQRLPFNPGMAFPGQPPRQPGTPGSNPSIPSTPTTPSTPFANELGHGPHPGTPMVLQSPGSSGIGPHQMVPHSPGSHYSHSLGRPMPAGITRMVHEPFSAQDGMHHLQLKPEQMELGSCGGAQRPMGMMTGATGMSLTQFGAVPIRSMSTVDSSMVETKSESGNELLKKLLQARHVRLQNQMGCAHEGMERKREVKGNAEWRRDGREDVDTEPDPSCPEQRMRKVPKGVGKGATRKKRKKEEEEKWKPYTSTDALMSQLKQQLALLPLIEPTIKVNLGLFPPHGSNRLNGDSQLKGSFGSAVLDGVPDYYTELIFKQTNLSNPPTPPASLPPTPPPPGTRQKLLNGFATAEELTGVCLCHGKDVSLRQSSQYPTHIASSIKRVRTLLNLPRQPSMWPHSRPQEAPGERESPDSIIFTSSPESVTGTEPPRFPVMDERPDTSASPVIPLLPSAGTDTVLDLRGFQPWPLLSMLGLGLNPSLPLTTPQPYNSNDHVSVTLTLSTNAADDINRVVSAVAHLLRVAVPNSYEYSDCPVQRLPTHPLLGTMHPGQHTEHADKWNNPITRPSWLKECCVILVGWKGKTVLPVIFLLMLCVSLNRAPPVFLKPPTKRSCSAAATATHSMQQPCRPPSARPRSNVHSKSHKPRAPRAVHAADMPEEPRLACSPARPPMSSPPRAPPRPIIVQPPACKKWKGVRWKKWRLQVTVLSHSGVLRPPSEDEIEELMRKLGTSLRPEPAPPDMRSCSFCHLQGDGATDGPARLLNLDLDIWVHLNCALWSSEVYETQAGALINVEGARRRGLGTKCGACLRMGATTSCNRPRCPNVYHFACALRMRCMFFKDKTVLCPAHRPRSSTGQELGCFAVLRRVYVQRDEVRQLASLVRRGPMGGGTFRVGSLLFHALGQILPGQASSPYFHSRTALYPIGYQATRLYWSTRYTNKRCRYLCSVSEAEGRPQFTVRIVEQGHEDLVHAASTPQGVWDKILEPVVRLRKGAEMLRLFPDYMRGEEMFGLTVQAVLRITESLPGVECCQNYMFRYGRHPLMELPLAVNPSGCARTEPRLRSHFKRPHTLNSSSNSKSFQSTMSGELSAPYSKQFVYSKSSQYRRMKTEWKINVYLARSRIQGLGLYASRDIEKHTMVIEYIGEIIRNEVANRHEKLYESTNRGVYMFRLDSEHVIDATITGGPARYINHSCAPNCVAELVTFDRENKIIISSCRRIQKGEELTYDYLFDFEDDQNKIPCHCGAINCRKWMN